MTFLQLQYFKTVAQLGSVANAAKALNVSPAAVSKTVHQLEEDLGYELFLREKRSITLNESGAIFLEHVSEILDSMMLAQLRLSQAQGKRQVVRVVFDVILDSPGRIPADLKRERPNLFLMSSFSSTPQGNHDLRLFATQNRMNSSSSMLLGEERWVAALPANHPKAKQREIKLARMKNESFIQFRGDHYAETMDEMCSEAGFKPYIAYSLSAESRGGIARLISEGLGCSIVPERVWRSEWSPSQVALVPFSDITRTRYIYASIPENRELTEEELFVIQYIKRKLDTEATD